jgi:peptide/nickel transport system ATP-binding protein
LQGPPKRLDTEARSSALRALRRVTSSDTIIFVAAVLEVRDLSIWFRTEGNEACVVHDLSFSLAEEDVLGLVGESGSGKSVTALAILGLLDKAARVEGSIRFAGEELVGLPVEKMRRYRGQKIAMIFQEPMTALNPVMVVGEQIAEALRTHHPEHSEREIRRRVLEAMEAVAIAEPAARYGDYPHQFSGGQRQRILIAMAIIGQPRLLIADEPTTALDVTVQAQILELLRELRIRYGLSMIFISHDLAVVESIADRVLVMRGGYLLEAGARAQIFAEPAHPYTRSLLGAVPTLRTDKTLPLATLAVADGDVPEPMVECGPGHWVRRHSAN